MMVHDYFVGTDRHMDKEDMVLCNVGFGNSFDGYTYGFENRDCYLLQYTLRGNGFLELKGHTYPINEKEGFIVPKSTDFRIINQSEWNLCWVGFQGPNVKKYLTQANLTENPVFKFENSSKFEAVIEKIYHNARNPLISNATLISYIYELLGLLLERNQENIYKDRSLSHFEKAAYYIDKNIFKKITIEQIVLEYDISAAQLYRSFKDHCGLSPKQYLDIKKMDKAKELIKSTTLSFHQISILLNYDHDETFYQIFKRVTGMRPSQFRDTVFPKSE